MQACALLKDEACGFKLHPLDPIGFMEFDLLGRIAAIRHYDL